MKIKKKLYGLITFLFLSILVIGCSSSGTLFQAIKDVPRDKSIIYIYRSSDNYNTEFTVKYNNKEICVLEKGCYFPIIAAQGKVSISAEVNFKLFTTGLLDAAIVGTSDFILKAEPEKTYYIKGIPEESSGQKLIFKLVPDKFGSIEIKNCKMGSEINE